MGAIPPGSQADAIAKSHEPLRIMPTLPVPRIDTYVMFCTAKPAAPLPALFCR
jgi:hypothetical protein